MTDKKLTDNEIIDGFNHCLYNKNNSCEGCCFKDVVCDASLYGKITTLRMVAEVIKRLKAENERLKSCVKTEKEVREIAKRTMEPLVKEITREQIDIAVKLAKAEAYKEFVEKLHEELRIYGIKDKFNKSVFFNVVDKAKKELVGE